MIGIDRPRLVTLLLGMTLLTAYPGCDRSQPVPVIPTSGPAAWFVEISAAVGLDFVHDAGPPPTDRYFMPQIMGSGAALFDADGDGRLDIYLVQNAGPASGATNKLFRQQPDGHFCDVSAGSGLDIAGFGMGVAIGDVNNDGWPDVFVTEFGRVRLFLNSADHIFRDVTEEAGLGSPLWATSASFVDYDRDGWLDLVVVNYVDYDPARPCSNAGGEPDYCPPKEFQGTVSNLYRNLGRTNSTTVAFENTTLRSGIGRVPGPGLGVVCADFDDDHWPDLLIANDEQPNRLWINQRDGTFVDEALLRGIGYNALGHAEANMGVAYGDVDGNGLADIFVTHLGEEANTLWLQQAVGIFQDRTATAALASRQWRGTGFGTVLVDFDNDTALDLAVANGRIRRQPAVGRAGQPFFTGYAERNQLFTNDTRGRFRDVSAENSAFCRDAAVSRGLAYGDFDNDGGVDLLVTHVGSRAALYRNVAPQRGHWLLVRAIDPALHRDAYGARLTLRADGRAFVRWVNPGSSYLCSNDPRAHFGLGRSTKIDVIEVLWPDGREEDFTGVSIDQVLVLQEGAGKASPQSGTPADNHLEAEK